MTRETILLRELEDANETKPQPAQEAEGLRVIDIINAIPETTPIRIYDNTCLCPSHPLIPLLYKSSILKGIYNLGDEKVFYVSAQYIDGIPYVIISLDRANAE